MHTPIDVIARTATVADMAAIVPAYGAAIADEAVASWLLPDERRRRQMAETAAFTTYLRGLLEAGVLVVAETDAIAGFSVWVPVDDSTADAVDEEAAALLGEVYGEYVSRVQQVAELTGDRHPTGQPYLYLQQMAVVPDSRGRGLGGAMLRHGLELADARRVPTYLEASTPRNRALYARHGFADVGEPIELPDDGPRLQPMRREPAA